MLDYISRLQYHLDTGLDQAVALALAAHRAFMVRLGELIGYEEHGGLPDGRQGLSEIEVLRAEVCRLRQQLAQREAA